MPKSQPNEPLNSSVKLIVINKKVVFFSLSRIHQIPIFFTPSKSDSVSSNKNVKKKYYGAYSPRNLHDLDGCKAHKQEFI